MRAILLALACSRLGASSIEPWLGGTRPYETAPQWEWNLGFKAAGPDFLGGARLDFGLFDHLMVQGSWTRDDLVLDGQILDAGLQARFSEEGALFADMGVYGGYRAWRPDSGLGREGPFGGAVLAWEPGEHSLALNLGYESVEGFAGSLAWRSPYLFSAMRLGFEWIFGDRVSQIWPQAAFNFPGDLSVQAGMVRLTARNTFVGPAETVVAMAPALSVSFLFFPSP